jgi:glycosyltransferase involved in cell wall biosynthesis
MKRISIMTPCFNEEGNVELLYAAVKTLFAEQLPQYEREHLFIDNASTDDTPTILRRLAAEDPDVKVILNTRNFGHVRSPYYGLLQTTGDAAILLVADFQDPVELIPTLVRRWEEGFKVVVGIKEAADETPLMHIARKLYYRILARLSDSELLKDFTGFGLYDRVVLDVLRSIGDPYPYFRGLICDIGYGICRIPYRQPPRRRGITKNNFYTLLDMALLGMTNHTKVPLRVATLAGFTVGSISFAISVAYLLAKLIFWNQFTLGTAPLLAGMFFLAAVQLFFVGVIGEYVGAVYTQVQKRPLVVERERLNFLPAQPPDQIQPATTSGGQSLRKRSRTAAEIKAAVIES